MRDPINIALIVALVLLGAVLIGAAGELGSEVGLRELEHSRFPAAVDLR